MATHNLKKRPWLGMKRLNPKIQGWQRWQRYSKWVVPVRERVSRDGGDLVGGLDRRRIPRGLRTAELLNETEIAGPISQIKTISLKNNIRFRRLLVWNKI